MLCWVCRSQHVCKTVERQNTYEIVDVLQIMYINVYSIAKTKSKQKPEEYGECAFAVERILFSSFFLKVP